MFKLFSTKSILTALALSGMALLGSVHFQKKPPVASSAVLISDAGGHGSGVHIGHGYIITAAHVVEENATMEITDSLGHKQTGTVLWSNKVYDVALIRVSNYATVGSARLMCSPVLHVGSPIRAVGNPLGLLNITTWGRVSSDIQERGPWKLSFVADMAIIPGMSGGPVYDMAGDVVGIAVGVAVMQMGFSGSMLSIGYVVPSEAVCALMARP